MKRNHVYFGFAVLFVLLTTMQTQARIQPNPNNGQNQGGKGIVFVNRSQVLQIANSLGLTVRSVKISKRDLAKLPASGPKGCGCAAALSEEAGAAGFSCLRNCLADWGVNTTTLAACAADCVVSGTLNPVAIAICATCVGVGEMIIIGCAAWCEYKATRNLAPASPVPPHLHRAQTRGGDSARLSHNLRPSGAMR